jgi:hypothetical protein
LTLQVMHLSGSNLTGTMPASLARLTDLQVLNVSSNRLQGPLPSTYAALRNLVVLDVSSNALIGKIPMEWFYMGGAGFDLQCLLLHSNPGLTVEADSVAVLQGRWRDRMPPLPLHVAKDPKNTCAVQTRE